MGHMRWSQAAVDHWCRRILVVGGTPVRLGQDVESSPDLEHQLAVEGVTAVVVAAAVVGVVVARSVKSPVQLVLVLGLVVHYRL